MISFWIRSLYKKEHIAIVGGREESTRYTKEELEEYFFEALAMFNDVLESNITSENVVLDFFTPANGLAVYKRFCEKYFPYKNEQHQK